MILYSLLLVVLMIARPKGLLNLDFARLLGARRKKG
jgi:hypothetical protein